MTVQLLVAALNQQPKELAEQMNIDSDAIIINQCDTFAFEEWEHRGHRIQVYLLPERGVGLSRNTALMRANHTISVFSDDDLIYESDYAKKIASEFQRNPQADMIVFQIRVGEDRQTYTNTERKRVHWYNCGRYGAAGFAVRTDKLHQSGITFSLLFGGGAKYSNGEDSLFIKEWIQKGYSVFTSPVVIAEEKRETSTWFKGYHEKFFKDRGVLYHFLYGRLAKLMALRFLLAHKEKICREVPISQAYQWMKQGLSEHWDLL